MIAHLNCYTYILFVVAFTLAGKLMSGSDLIVSCSLQLVVAGY